MSKAKHSDDPLAGLSALALLEASSSGAIVQQAVADDDSYRVLYLNPAARDMTQLSVDSVSVVSVMPFIKLPPKTRCPVCSGKRIKGMATPAYHGAVLVTSSGDELKVKVKHTHLPHDMSLSVIDPFAEDVTLTQAHSDFVSTVSHEFRTPLTSIKGFADTLLRYGSQLPPDQHKRFISIIKDQADRLSRLVENLLTVSKLGASRLEMTCRPISVNRMIEKVIQNIKGKGEFQRNFKLDYANPLPELWADPDKLEQVLTNLIDNAVKYSYDGSTVTVAVHPDDVNPEKLTIRIADQGVGIPAEHLPKIFTKFSRIDNPLTRLVEGTGLGLYITKSLTLAMGGDIHVTSELNQGTTFRLSFPIATPEKLATVNLNMSDDDLDDDEIGRP